MTTTTKLGRVITLGASFQKVTLSFDHMVFQSHMTNEIRCISTTTRPMVIKFGKVVSYFYQPYQRGDLLREALNLKVSWPCNHLVLGFWLSLIQFVVLEGQRLSCRRFVVPCFTSSEFRFLNFNMHSKEMSYIIFINILGSSLVGFPNNVKIEICNLKRLLICL